MEGLIILLLVLGFFCLAIHAAYEIIEYVFRLLTAPRRCECHFHYFEDDFDDYGFDFDDELDDREPLEPKAKRAANRSVGK